MCRFLSVLFLCWGSIWQKPEYLLSRLASNCYRQPIFRELEPISNKADCLAVDYRVWLPSNCERASGRIFPQVHIEQLEEGLDNSGRFGIWRWAKKYWEFLYSKKTS